MVGRRIMGQKGVGFDLKVVQEISSRPSLSNTRTERISQIVKHGFDADYDDKHTCWELHRAATAIMLHHGGYLEEYARNELWPWPDKIEMFNHILVKEPYDIMACVGALILADMDRLDRIEPHDKKETDHG